MLPLRLFSTLSVRYITVIFRGANSSFKGRRFSMSRRLTMPGRAAASSVVFIHHCSASTTPLIAMGYMIIVTMIYIKDAPSDASARSE
jgi:hypothetical protein